MKCAYTYFCIWGEWFSSRIRTFHFVVVGIGLRVNLNSTVRKSCGEQLCITISSHKQQDTRENWQCASRASIYLIYVVRWLANPSITCECSAIETRSIFVMKSNRIISDFSKVIPRDGYIDHRPHSRRHGCEEKRVDRRSLLSIEKEIDYFRSLKLSFFFSLHAISRCWNNLFWQKLSRARMRIWSKSGFYSPSDHWQSSATIARWSVHAEYRSSRI